MSDASFSSKCSSYTNLFLRDILESLPKPDKVWHTVQAHDRTDGIKWAHERWKPSVYVQLDALHGYRGQVLPSGYYAVTRPMMAERISRFRKALGIVCTFRSWEDLLPICVHRRQVTNMGGLREIDHPLYLLVCEAVADRFFRPIEIKYLADRMPPRSNIRSMLYVLAACELKRRMFSPSGSAVR